MNYPFLKIVISFILLVCSVVVLVYGLFFLETPASRTPQLQPAERSGQQEAPAGPSGVTPSGGTSS